MTDDTGVVIPFPKKNSSLLAEELVVQAEHLYAASLHLLLTALEYQLSLMGVSRGVSNDDESH